MDELMELGLPFLTCMLVQALEKQLAHHLDELMELEWAFLLSKLVLK